MARKVSDKLGRNVALAAVAGAVGLVSGVGVLPGLAALGAVYGYEVLDDRSKGRETKTRARRSGGRRGRQGSRGSRGKS